MSRAHAFSHGSDVANSLRNFEMTELDKLGEDHPNNLLLGLVRAPAIRWSKSLHLRVSLAIQVT